MARRDLILGIDQGTTSTRAALLTPEGVLVGQTAQAHAQLTPREGWVEHDAREIWAALQVVVARVLAATPGAAPRVAGVALANQGETVVAFDRLSGEPLGHALVWQDTRTQAAVEALAAGDAALAATVRARTGLTLDAYFAAPKLRWLLEHAPGAAALARQGRLGLSTLDGWLLWQLSGGRAFVTDVSTAARTLLFDVHTLAYDEALLRAFGVPRGALPEVRPSAGELCQVAEGPLAGVPVLASLVDQPAALFGQGCLLPGQAKATFGTGCFVYVNAGVVAPTPAPGLLATVAWQRDGVVSHALDGGVLAAGSLLGWLRSGLGVVGADAEVEPLAASVPDAGGVVCVPALAGLGAPHWDRAARGALVGLGLSTTRAHVVRAALEGIACRVAEIVGAMHAGGQAISSLRVDGGLTASATLMQTVADVLGLPVEVAAEPEATLLGACLLAARAAGLLGSDAEVVARAGVARSFAPGPGVARAADLRDRFARARAHASALAAR